MIYLSACSAEHKKGMDDANSINGKNVEQLLSNPSLIVFEDINDRIIQPKCMNCHNSENRKDNVDLSSYEALFGKNGGKLVIVPTRPAESKLYEVTQQPASSSRHMPPTKSDKQPLTDLEKKLLYSWIENGAKNENSQQIEIPPTLKEELTPYFNDPKIIDYQVVNKYVFEHACNTCHSQNGEKAKEFSDAWQLGADMTTYKSLTDDATNALFGLPPNLIKGDPAKSRIYIEVAVKQSMPPRKSYDPLDAFRVKLFRLWLLNCAIENYESTVETGDSLMTNSRPDAEKVRQCEI